MNVPTFTGFNKAVFFVSVYKITHSRQGDSFGGNEGWITYLLNTAEPFRFYKNTFLQTSRFLYCAKDFSHHCIVRNQWRYVMHDQCLQANSPAGNKRATLDDTPGCAIMLLSIKRYTDIRFRTPVLRGFFFLNSLKWEKTPCGEKDNIKMVKY